MRFFIDTAKVEDIKKELDDLDKEKVEKIKQEAKRKIEETKKATIEKTEEIKLYCFGCRLLP
mgnify:CR=1 FL=1